MLGEKMKRFNNHYIIEMPEDEMMEMFDSGQLTSVEMPEDEMKEMFDSGQLTSVEMPEDEMKEMFDSGQLTCVQISEDEMKEMFESGQLISVKMSEDEMKEMFESGQLISVKMSEDEMKEMFDSGQLTSIKKEAYDKPTHLAQNEDSWNRTVTLPPSVREVFNLDPQAPKDSLGIPEQKEKDGIHTIENGISKSIYQKNLNIPLTTEEEIPSSTEDIIDDNNNNNNIEDDIIELSTEDDIPSSTEDIIDDNNNNIEDDIIEVKSSLQIYTFNPVDFNWQMNRCPIIKLVVNSTSYPVYKSDNMLIGIPKDKKTIIGDGNCFFRSISFMLTGIEDHHLEVRKCVVKHILFLGDNIQKRITLWNPILKIVICQKVESGLQKSKFLQWPIY